MSARKLTPSSLFPRLTSLSSLKLLILNPNNLAFNFEPFPPLTFSPRLIAAARSSISLCKRWRPRRTMSSYERIQTFLPGV